MAPIKKRNRPRARVAKALRPIPDYDPSTDLEAANGNTDPATASRTPFESFTTNKKDKQRIRRSQLLSRIEKSAPGKKALKRRRPSRKLVAGLEGLLETLPDPTGDAADDGDEWEGLSDEDDNRETDAMDKINRIARVRRRKRDQEGKMVLSTLKSRPGAMKKKAKLEEQERERFARNMAQMTQGQGEKADNVAVGKGDAGQADQGGHNAQRWAALRGFIGQTMMQNPAFSK